MNLQIVQPDGLNITIHTIRMDNCPSLILRLVKGIVSIPSRIVAYTPLYWRFYTG